MEGQETRRRSERPFRKEEEGVAVLQSLYRELGLRATGGRGSTLDEQRAEPAQRQAEPRGPRQLALGDEGEERRQRRGQDERAMLVYERAHAIDVRVYRKRQHLLRLSVSRGCFEESVDLNRWIVNRTLFEESVDRESNAF